VLALLLGLTLPALANGQTTHIWVTRHAIEHLAPGRLRDLLADPANEAALIHGTMFPDGGYPLGHPYAEDAHWEGLQGDYLDWIRAQHAPPFSDEGALHVAFLMGLASHGMADQTFDAFYFEWSRIKDAEHGWARGESFDEASDFIFASLHGAQTVPERWVPEQTLIELYAQRGIEVDADTLDDGQSLLEAAVALVGLGSQNPELVADYAAAFPWGGTHLDDPELPGTPACEGAWVARYWEELYARLLDAERPRAVLGTWPQDGTWGHARDRDTPEARISIILPVGLESGSPDPEFFTVEDDAGQPLPVEPWVYYGQGSHVVHLTPAMDWPGETALHVRVGRGLPYRNGERLEEDVTFTIHTTPPADPAKPRVEPDREGGCSSAPAAAGFLGIGLAVLSLGRRRR